MNRAAEVALGRDLSMRAYADDQADGVLEAHRAVFGSAVDRAWLDWKYGRGQAVGLGLWQGHTLAAFCGGLPRTLWWAGQRRRGLQIVDVLVRPAWRQGGRRQGAFYRVSQAFYAAQIGAGRAFAAGYGFPSHRHLSLAQRLGVLRDGGPVTAAVWGEASRAVMDQTLQDGRGWVIEDVPAGDVATAVARGWMGLRQGLPAAVVGDRSPAWLHWRHLQAPGGQRRWWIGLRRPWRRWPEGLAIVAPDDRTGQAMWLDWVGPPALMRTAWAAALQRVLGHGGRELHGWFSDLPWAELAHTQPLAQVEAARIGIPVTTVMPDGPTTPSWWLMAGDTDFL